ncbi:condensation domain-containing protein [Amycolatopsis sp. 195334CR]|uniref:condensation domain-containing protein n=1 Tax=Amycolatopsis sp. 195334CR TaxID=2814588 RepID=UPI001A8CCADD|nr:condensation domain-containing protein [Amycolatopsis sp. 195334CR]MBN6039784.1 peptide synthetase [Amycolatopsis sp. 195334CR]
MNAEPIAVIGAAFALPGGLRTFDALHTALSDGLDAVRAPGADRVVHAGGESDVDYLRQGYLDRVDVFDHGFFGLSLGESELMDPHQRLSLQLVHEALEHAGYAPSGLRGSDTAVIVSAPDPAYARLYQGEDSRQVLGSLPAAVAARIAYLLDLTGPALVVDTACSGSLNAVALAVAHLRAGRTELAVCGGLSVDSVLTPARGHEPLPGVGSGAGVCRPFDAGADGTVGGEGGGFVVLKRLSAALSDQDNVLAVLRGVAVNHNGARAVGMSAPSPSAQAEVIRAARHEAGIAAETIGYVEAHGSATPLGDVIEVTGLAEAFPGGSPPIGSVKSNFGHLDHAAGIAGLLKVICALRYGTRYPTVHFERSNPAFPAPIVVETEPVAWTEEPRRAGLSSFGITGTNVHVVVEQAPTATAVPDDGEPRLVTVSAKTPAALTEYLRSLAEFTENTSHSLAQIASVLNAGRDDHPYRRAFVARDVGELAGALRQAVPPERPSAEVPVVLLFSGDGEDWARQFELYQLVRSLGLDDTRMVGSGTGNLAVRLARGRITPAEAEAAAADLTPGVDPDGLRRAVRGFVSDGAVLLEMGKDGILAREIAELEPDLPIVRLLADGGPLAALAELYELGVDLAWPAGDRPPRIEVPTYPFEPVSCWVPRPQPTVPAPPPVAVVQPPPADDLEQAVAAVWARVLKAEGIGPDSDYFELGGTSIAGISLIREFENELQARLSFTELYEHRTVRALAALIAQRRTDGPVDWSIPVLPRGGPLPISIGQAQLWYLDVLDPGTPLYNIPLDLRYRGPLDREAMRGAFADLSARHEIMRTRIVADENGRPHALADLPGVDLRIVELPSEAALAEAAHREGARPFDLAAGPLVRAVLFAIGEHDHQLLCTWHHIAFDGWSPRIFLRDLSEFYTARVTGAEPVLPELPVQYPDFAGWQRTWLDDERRERALVFWRRQLADLPRTELPLDHPRPPVETHAGKLLGFTLEYDVAERLRELSASAGVTTFVTMLAVFDVLLYRWAGHEDVVVGAATSGRINPATHELIGYFNNVVPFRTRLDGNPGFRDLLLRVAGTVAGVLDHEELPFADIVADLRPERDPSRHPLFTVSYTHQNTETHPAEVPGMVVSTPEERGYGIVDGTSKLDLTLGLADQDGGPMGCYLEYATALFDEATMVRLAALFRQIVAEVLDHPDRPIGELGRGAENDEPRGDSMSTPTDTERVLHGIWTELLGRDSIGPDEDFFLIGGDSILSVGVAARAARAGITVTAQDMLKYPTLRKLAEIAAPAPAPEPATADSGPIPLTPLMLDMLEAGGQPGASDFVVSELLEVAPGTGLDRLRGALAELVRWHEPLRYRYRRNRLGWRIEPAPAVSTSDILDSKVLPPLDEAAELALLTTDAAELSAELDITAGRMVRGRFYDRGASRPGLMLLVLHHFAHDEISTVPLLDDLNGALTGKNDATAPRPPALRNWSCLLTGLAQSDELAGELDYWTSVLRQGAGEVLPESSGNAPGVLKRVVEGERLAKLLYEPGPTSREASLCAVACGWSRWRGEPGAFLSTIGHGYPNPFRPEDRSRSLGWFTNGFPMYLPVDPAADAAAALPEIADVRRSVPNDGVGYGVLRRLSPATPDVREFRSLAEPTVMVEHRTSGVNPIRLGGPLSIRSVPIPLPMPSLLALRPILFSTSVRDGRAEIELVHSERFGTKEMEVLADRVAEAFAELDAVR